MKHHSTLTQAEHFSKFNRGGVLERSTFNRDSNIMTSIDAGYVYPLYIDEVLPGDTFNITVESFARLSTPIAPIFDNLYADWDFFFVPTRQLWSKWRNFNGEQTTTAYVSPGDYVIPSVAWPTAGFAAFSLGDYLGLPTGVANTGATANEPLNVLPFRAVNYIWNEFYRDQNLQEKLYFTDEDSDTGTFATNYNMANLRRGKRKDYFTGCLPWVQKGDEVVLPIGSTAPVTSTGVPPLWTQGTQNRTLRFISGDDKTYWDSAPTVTSASIRFGATTGLQADLSAATAANINDVRYAFQVQRLLERDARAGTRYTEMLYAHFGVTNPDLAHRPELLHQQSTRVNFTPVAQTSESATSAQGNLAAFATFRHNPKQFVKSFSEHGYIIGFMSIRADLNYQQGLEKMWTRRTRYDFYLPVLAHVGEQPVLNKEIYLQDVGTQNTANDGIFGYQEAWAEYRYKPSKITGALRSNYAQSLDLWHLAQDFASLPTLSSDFIEEDPPMDRILATPGLWGQQFIVQGSVQNKTTRVMPVFSVPGLVDHF